VLILTCHTNVPLLVTPQYRRYSNVYCKNGININSYTYEGITKCFRTGRLEREMQMVQLSATRCSCIAILWVSLVSFAAITLCVASQRVFVVVGVYFIIDSVRELLDTPSYLRLLRVHKSIPYNYDNCLLFAWSSWNGRILVRSGPTLRMLISETTQQIISVGFWRWCISVKRIVFLDFIHRLVSQKTNKIEEIKNYRQNITIHTSTNKSHKCQLLTTDKLTWAYTHINPWSKSDTGGNKWPSHCTLHST
jgi:hypothetical protein